MSGTEKRQRNRVLNLRLSPAEQERLRRVAAERGQSMAGLLRAALQREGVLPSPTQK